MDPNAPYLSSSLPIADRIADLLGRMMLEEKVGQMCQYLLPPEDLSQTQATAGSGNADDSTVCHDEAEQLSVPALIQHSLIGSILSETDSERLNAAERYDAQQWATQSRPGIPLILGVDVLRDGRWGRSEETFGEDPHLVSEMGRAMIRGYQDGPSEAAVVEEGVGTVMAAHDA